MLSRQETDPNMTILEWVIFAAEPEDELEVDRMRMFLYMLGIDEDTPAVQVHNVINQLEKPNANRP